MAGSSHHVALAQRSSPTPVKVTAGKPTKTTGDAPDIDDSMILLRRQASRAVRANPPLARFLLSALLLAACLIGAAVHAASLRLQLAGHRLADASVARYADADAGDITVGAAAGHVGGRVRRDVVANASRVALTFVVPAEARGGEARRRELDVVRGRNLALGLFDAFVVVCGGADGVRCDEVNASLARQAAAVAPPAAPATRSPHHSAHRQLRTRLRLHALSDDERMSFDVLVRAARHGAGATAVGSSSREVAVVAKPDIFFDASVQCARLVRARTLLALSRHASPDCALASGHAERADLCAMYGQPDVGAAHDVFVMRVRDGDGDSSANGGGSAAVESPMLGGDVRDDAQVVMAFRRGGWDVVNPCARMHAFHQHCALDADADRSDGARRPSLAKARASRAGWVHGRYWMEPEFTDMFAQADCLTLGASIASLVSR